MFSITSRSKNWPKSTYKVIFPEKLFLSSVRFIKSEKDRIAQRSFGLWISNNFKKKKKKTQLDQLISNNSERGFNCIHMMVTLTWFYKWIKMAGPKIKGIWWFEKTRTQSTELSTFHSKPENGIREQIRNHCFPNIIYYINHYAEGFKRDVTLAIN